MGVGPVLISSRDEKIYAQENHTNKKADEH